MSNNHLGFFATGLVGILSLGACGRQGMSGFHIVHLLSALYLGVITHD